MDPVRALALCSDGNQGLATWSTLHESGVSAATLHRAVRAGRVHRVARAVYAVHPLAAPGRFLVTEAGPDPDWVRRVRADLMGSGAVATLRTAAALHGWELLVEPRGKTQSCVPQGSWRPHGSGCQQRSRLRCERRVVLPGTEPLWVSTAEQTAVDCLRLLPDDEAVVACDSALRSGRVSTADLTALLSRSAGLTGIGRAHDLLALADPWSGSVLESLTRILMNASGLTGWCTQHVVARDPELRVDFCFAHERLVVEVDGARWHTDPARDQGRDNRLTSLGWRVLRFSWSQVVRDPDQVVRLIRESVAQAENNPRA